MFFTTGFSESISPNSVFTKMNALVDDQVRTEGKKLFVPKYNKLFGVITCGGVNGLRSRMVSPSLRMFNPLEVSPVYQSGLPENLDDTTYFPDSPVELSMNESLENEVNSANVGANRQTTVIWLAEGQITPVKGKIASVMFQVTMALVEGVYVAANVVFPEPLPVGTYTVVGARLNCAAGIFARFIPIGSPQRPGFICNQTVNERDIFWQRYGNLGPWFDFDTTQEPQIAIVGNAAVVSTTYSGVIDILM